MAKKKDKIELNETDAVNETDIIQKMAVEGASKSIQRRLTVQRSGKLPENAIDPKKAEKKSGSKKKSKKK